MANKTGNSCNSKAYNDYTNKVADFEQGQTYNTKLAITTYDAYLNVWIDFDDDGNFNKFMDIIRRDNNGASNFKNSTYPLQPLTGYIIVSKTTTLESREKTSIIRPYINIIHQMYIINLIIFEKARYKIWYDTFECNIY